MSTPDASEHELSPREKKLAYEPIKGLIWQMTGPALVAMLINSLYNLVDRLYVARLGGDVLAGLSISFPLQMFFNAIGFGIAVGSSSIISRMLGARKHDRAEKTIGNALMMIGALSVILVPTTLFFIDYIVSILGGTVAQQGYSTSYLRIIFMGLPFLFLSVLGNQTTRAEGNAKGATVGMVIGALANIILDPIFIFVLGMGVSGAAMATIIGPILTCLYYLWLQKRKGSVLYLHRKNVRFESSLLKETSLLGLPVLARQSGMTLVALSVNFSLTKLGGGEYVAAFGMTTSLAIFFFLPSLSLMQGISPIIGYNYGAKNYIRVEKTLKYACIFATCYFVFVWFCSQFLASPLLSLFVKADEKEVLLPLSITLLRHFTMLWPLIGIQLVLANYFQVIGKAGAAFFLNISRQYLFFLPLLFFLTKHRGMQGLLWTWPLSDGLAIILTGVWFLFEFRELKKLEATNPLA